MMQTTASDTLLRKAARDAGFDLLENLPGQWLKLSVSGAPGEAWISTSLGRIELALPSEMLYSEASNAGGAPLGAVLSAPQGTHAVVAFSSVDAVFRALNRVRFLLDQSPRRLGDRVRERLARISSTERTAEVTQRVGQDVFREALQEYWDRRCAVTGLSLPPLLRASHSKPWAEASDEERLDVHNGFLLAVHLDALFDKGLITFLDDGALLVSGQVSAEDRDLLRLQPGIQRLRWVADGHRPYLAYHRDALFRR